MLVLNILVSFSLISHGSVVDPDFSLGVNDRVQKASYTSISDDNRLKNLTLTEGAFFPLDSLIRSRQFAPPPIFSSHRSTDALIHVSSGSGVARYSENGIAFGGRTRNKVPSSRTTSFSDLHSDSVHIHEKIPSFSKAGRRAPGKPTGVTVAPYNTGADARGTLNISWTANPNGNKAITNHEIEWSPNGNNPWNDLRTVSGQLTNTLFTGLSPGTTRHIRIRSQDADGWGEWSNVVSGTTNIVAAPGSPTGMTAVPGGTTPAQRQTRLTISWTPQPSQNNPITGVQVDRYSTTLEKWEIVLRFISTTDDIQTSYTDAGRSPGTTYRYRVRNRNVDGWGDWSEVTGTTDSVPGIPTGMTAVPGGTTPAQRQTRLTISWTPQPSQNNPITGVQVDRYSTTLEKWEIVLRFISTTDDIQTSYTDIGRSPGTTYRYRVRNRNVIGWGGWSEVTGATDAVPVRAPAAPTGLTAKAMGPTKIKLTWTAPSDNGGAAITGYKIEARTGTLADWADLVTDTKNTKTDTTHTGLTPSTPWSYRVSAINSEGPGTASNVATATTATPTRPSAPRNLTATASGRTTINLTWMAPTNTGGLRIRGYELQFSEDKTPRVWIQLGGGNITQTSFAHTGRSAGTRYHYRLRASNTRGSSGWTSSVSATTDAATAPGVPRNVTAAADGQTVINLTWEAPADNGGAAITGYQIFISETGSPPWALPFQNYKGTSYKHTGLSAGAERYYQVRARNSVGLGPFSKTVNATTAAAPTLTTPAAPTGLRAEAEGPETISLSWNAPTNTGGAAITGYQIEVSPTGKANTWADLVANTGSTTTGYVHRGLDAGTTRHYRVYAINSQGAGAVSNVDDATTLPATVPAAPTELTAAHDGQTTINLFWKAPTNRGGVPITGYQIEVSPNGTDTWTNVTPAHTGTGRTYSHTQLSPGTTRHYRVYARNSKGTSAAASNVASATTAAVRAPGAPPDLQVFSPGFHDVRLTWGRPRSDSPITGYKVEWSTDGGTNWETLIGYDDLTRTRYQFLSSRLTPGSVFHFRVLARSALGDSAPSDAVSVTAASAPRSGIATNVRVRQTLANAAQISWDAPTGLPSGHQTFGYVVYKSDDDGDFWSLFDRDVTTTTYTDAQVSAGKTYGYRVTTWTGPSENEALQGQFSDAAFLTITIATATAPGAPTGLTATASDPTIINLSWTAPTNTGGAAITGYRIEESPTGVANTWINLVANTQSTATTYAHTGLSANTTRHYRVRAINSVNSGAPSNVANATTAAATAPGAPTGLTATADGQTIINLSWTAPTNTGGAPITGYQIEVSPSGTSNWSDLVANTTATTYAHTGLSAGETRHYRVRAINSVGPGAVSSTRSATTDTPNATVPDAPSQLTATAAGRTIINLSWTAPTNTGGAAITGYQIEVSNTGTANTWTNLVANTQSTTTTYAHTGLSAGVTRHYRVRAINSVGPGAVSATRSATTDTPNATVPDAPSQLTATAAGRTSINLSWTAPSDNGGATITGYQIEVSNAGAWSELATTRATTYTHTNLAAGTTQVYRVRAVNSVGNSDASNTVSATTDALATPDAPTELTITASGPSTLVLSWTAPLDDGGSAITGYRIDTSSDGQSDWTVLVASTPSTTYTVTNLPLPVYFRVIALNAIGQGTPSEVVNVTPKALSLSSTISDQIYPIGQPIAQVMLPEARDGTAPYTYTLTPDLPAGLTRSERTLRGTPSELTAMTSFTWAVQDATGSVARQDFGLEVYRMSFTTRVDDQVVPMGQPIGMLVLPEVSGGKDPVTYSFTVLSLPSGLLFDLPTRTVSGTPLAVTPPTPMTFKAVDVHGAEDSLNFSIEVVSRVHAEAQTALPHTLTVHANYPNPFTRSTRIVFDLPWPAQVEIDVLDVTGRRVYAHPLVSLTAGWEHELTLDQLDLPAGAYLYRVMASSLESSTSAVQVGHLMRVQ